RIAHQVLARADLDGPPAQRRDIIDGRLECPVVGPDQIGPGLAHGDPGTLAHLRVHSARELLLLPLRDQVVCPSDRPGKDEDEADTTELPCQGGWRNTGHGRSPEAYLSHWGKLPRRRVSEPLGKKGTMV